MRAVGTCSSSRRGDAIDARDRRRVDLGDGSELVYVPRFLPHDRAWTLFDYLNKEIPWTRPTISVFGGSCLQPRDACYIADDGLPEFQYSGYQPRALSWDNYPLLKNTLAAVHEALPGSKFNSLLLNRYKGGSDYVAWHSDDEKLYGDAPEIASLSLGCDRDFLLRKKKLPVATLGKRPREHCLEQYSLLLKHGSLLVMKGYTQRDWLHSVPKRTRAGSIRINLTFRLVQK
ncbi:oxidoreductase, 2OG-Fe(II) oxygenase family protein [Wolffia australiana]